jgi:hypothetical protein
VPEPPLDAPAPPPFALPLVPPVAVEPPLLCPAAPPESSEVSDVLPLLLQANPNTPTKSTRRSIDEVYKPLDGQPIRSFLGQYRAM